MIKQLKQIEDRFNPSQTFKCKA